MSVSRWQGCCTTWKQSRSVTSLQNGWTAMWQKRVKTDIWRRFSIQKNRPQKEELTNGIKVDNEVDTLVREYRKHENEELSSEERNRIFISGNRSR